MSQPVHPIREGTVTTSISTLSLTLTRLTYRKTIAKHFWVGLMVINKFFFGLGTFSIKDGSEIRF
jgi:hypothetical protein